MGVWCAWANAFVFLVYTGTVVVRLASRNLARVAKRLSLLRGSKTSRRTKMAGWMAVRCERLLDVLEEG